MYLDDSVHLQHRRLDAYQVRNAMFAHCRFQVREADVLPPDVLGDHLTLVDQRHRGAPESPPQGAACGHEMVGRERDGGPQKTPG